MMQSRDKLSDQLIDQLNDFYAYRELIGEGKMAKVYRWEGHAYKCFNEGYPQDWLDYEMHIQNIVHGTDLNTVAYYPCSIPSTIKMDLVVGKSLAERVLKEKYKNGVEDLISLFSSVHAIRGLDLPKLTPYLKEVMPKVPVDEALKNRALTYIAELPDEDVLCHLDFHFLNLMHANDDYTIIDWVNAKSGHPLYDFARSYVIFYEFAFRLSGKYLKLLKKAYVYNESELKKAIFVMALHRLTETDSIRIRTLIDQLSQDLTF